MNLHPFPTSLLRILDGSLSKRSSGWCLELNLVPFDLPNGYPEGDEFAENYKDIQTNIRIDFWDVKLRDIGGKALEFQSPNNDIEGSIYILHAHHPVDITKLDCTNFSAKRKKPGTMRLDAIFCLEFEGLGYSEDAEYSNTQCSFNLTLTPSKGGWDIEPTQPL